MGTAGYKRVHQALTRSRRTTLRAWLSLRSPCTGRRRRSATVRPDRDRPRVPAGARAPARQDRALAGPPPREHPLLVRADRPARGQRRPHRDDLARDRAPVRPLARRDERHGRARRGCRHPRAGGGQQGDRRRRRPPADARARRRGRRSRRPGADVGVVWLRERDELVVRAVASSSGAVAAEIEGLRAQPGASRRAVTDTPRGQSRGHGRRGPVHAARGRRGRARRARPAPRATASSTDDAKRVASLAADLAALAVRLCGSRRPARRLAGVDPRRRRGRALGRLREEHAGARIARLAGIVSGAEAAFVWLAEADGITAGGSHGLARGAGGARAARGGDPERAPRRLGRQTSRAWGRSSRSSSASRRSAPCSSSSPPARAPGAGRARAARQLRRPRGPRAALVRARARRSAPSSSAAARCSSSSARRSRGSRSRTRSRRRSSGSRSCSAPTGWPSTCDEDGRLGTAAVALARRARTSRWRRRCSTLALGPLARPRHRADRGRRRATAARGGARGGGRGDVAAVIALPLLVADQPIGLLAVYPRRPRPLTPNESALLVALAAQLAVAVQNARLHERATQLGLELESALAVRARGGRPRPGALRDLALVRAEPVARRDARRARERRS